MKEAAKYRINYVTYQIGVMFFMFVSLHLKDDGYNGMQYGAVMSFTPLAVAVALPFFSFLDRGTQGRKILVACSSCVMAVATIVLGFDILSVIMVAVFAASIAKATINTSIDNLTTVYCIETDQEFSKFRAFSSFGYIVANLIGGFVYLMGFKWILVISVVGTLLYLVGILRVKPLSLDQSIKKHKPDFKLLFTNKPFLMFLVYQMLCFAVMTFINSYDIIYQSSIGLPSYVFGITTAIRVGTEIVTFSVLRRNKRISYKTMLAVTPILLVIESVCYFFLIPSGFIYGLMIFAGVASACMIFANNKYLNKIVRPQNVTVGLYAAAMVQNLFTGIMTLIGGSMIDKYGVKYLFLGSAVVLAIAFVFTVCFVKKEDRISFADPE
ncbi:MAG: MFS transporter [Clostridiales bacterium]|jgi:MFS family permease|nr:MFS transporter [Clostridiales bacterium]